MPRISPLTVNAVKQTAGHARELLTSASDAINASKRLLSRGAEDRARDIVRQIAVDQTAKIRLTGSLRQIGDTATDQTAVDMYLSADMMARTGLSQFKRGRDLSMWPMRVIDKMFRGNTRTAKFSRRSQTIGTRQIQRGFNRISMRTPAHGVM